MDICFGSWGYVVQSFDKLDCYGHLCELINTLLSSDC